MQITARVKNSIQDYKDYADTKVSTIEQVIHDVKETVSQRSMSTTSLREDIKGVQQDISKIQEINRHGVTIMEVLNREMKGRK
jgi:hypothetical protein